MAKLESYMVGGTFMAAESCAVIESNTKEENVKRVLEELAYFPTQMQILGVSPSDRARG